MAEMNCRGRSSGGAAKVWVCRLKNHLISGSYELLYGLR
jgi:hypothetical protein